MKRRVQWRCAEEQSTRQFQLRLFGVAALFGVMVLLLGWRVVDLQVIRGEELAKRAVRQQERLVAVEAERGTIYDRQGRVLAMNTELPSIFAVPTSIEHPVALGTELAGILGQPKGDVIRRLSTDRSFVWIDRHASPARAQAALELGGEGIGVVAESRRFYPNRSLMSHLIGFAGLDNQGLEGIERSYDRLLRGERGWVAVERDATGRIIFPKGRWPKQPTKGKDLRLTVDAVIQYATERALDAVIRETNAKRAIAIMMEPNTGAILAMAVRPEFNPNQVSGLDAGQWRNLAITDLYEPGSTVKPLVLAGALTDGVVDLNERIDCEQGTMIVANSRLHDHQPYGFLTPQQIIQHSSNIGAAKIGMRLGAERLRYWLTAFGLGQRTGIDLEGEASGLLRPVSQWSGLSVASHAIGQELGITPLQLVTAYAAIANGGWLVRPHLVEAVVAADGSVSRPASVDPVRRVVSAQITEQLREMLVSVSESEGTGAKASLTGFRVAGKTGTAQKINPQTHRYDPQAVVSSFIGFVPAESPKFVLLVVVDEPNGKGWGGTVAAPLFHQIAGEALHYLGVVPQSAPGSSRPVQLARSVRQKEPARPVRSMDIDRSRVAVAGMLPVTLPEATVSAVMSVE